MDRILLRLGLLGCLGLSACALETTGTGNFVGEGGESTGGSAPLGIGGEIIIVPDGTGGYGFSVGGTGGAGTSATGGTSTSGTGGTGGTSTSGTGGTGTSGTCGDGTIDPGESCDPGGTGTTLGCLDCALDPSFLSRVNEATFTDPNGRVHYYFVNATPQSFDPARRACQTDGADLVTLRYADEQRAVAALGASLSEYWIGARDPNDDADTLTWVVIEPDTGYRPPSGVVINDATEECIVVQVADTGTGTDGWRDRDCAERRPSICEWLVPGTPAG